ncbi:alpha,alpha-trehalase nth1 [Teratosphaeriaceae sp. CCFEE 6253]|nr:alpha,alpha-trehalase nth1 [Teratosphaeriaceae sp. CCFEE 6253]
MRTSRVSRETQRIVTALSPTTIPGSRRSIRSRPVANEAHEDGTAQALNKSAGTAESSDLSSAPASPATTLGKRKRHDADTPSTSVTTLSAEATAIRRSPRKAPKPEANGDNVATKRKAKRQPAKHIKGPTGDLAVEPPANWEKVWSITAAMRQRILAPVDTMGCESLAEESRSPRDRRLQTLVALMLSSQTKDTVTAAAMRNLQENLPGGFTLESLLAVDPEQLNELIGKVGFHNNKTRFLKFAAVILRDQSAGDIPDTIEGLVSLPGVGPKMAYLTMSAAWGRDEGIGVDVHVHRITNLWGWHKTSTPEQTRAELEAWLPRERWHAINHLLVGFGQTVCLPVGRRCGECDLGKEGLCPSQVKGSPVKRRVKREVKTERGDDAVVKAESVVVERDEVGTKVRADLGESGIVEEVQTAPGAPCDES